MHLPLPLTRDLLLIGGGHSHALVLKMWAMNPLPGVRLTVVNPSPTAPYTGMLPGYVAGHYGKDAVEIDLVRLARIAGARLIIDSVNGLDRSAQECTTHSGRRLRYDVASIDIGVTAQASEIPGFDQHAVGVKPMDRFASTWDRFVQEVNTSPVAPSVTILGGGIGGAEIALAIATRLKHTNKSRVTLIERETLLARQNPRLANKVQKALSRAGVNIRENSTVLSVHADKVVLSDKKEIASTLTIGAAGARAHDWLVETGLDLKNGYVCVGPTLQTTNDTYVLAVGDCAHMGFAPRPKAGVFAVRAAPVLYHNLVALLSGGNLRPFNPQKDFLKIMSLGEKTAIAEKWGISVAGDMIWRWKDRIDQKFMHQFTNLDAMKPMALPVPRAEGVDEALGPKPLCGGCGAKVSFNGLSDVLRSLNPVKRADVLNTPGDDAAILAGPDGQYQVMTTDHLRSFCDDPALMAHLGAIHALGDIWAMGAKPQAATVSLTIPPMSLVLQNNLLTELMAAITACLNETGATLAGGHTSKGAELSIGLTITGLVDRPLTNAGAQVGDVLILTKPIGTGTILAAEMQGVARGEHVINAYRQMSESMATASEILATAATAATDITGFGLAGHLNTISQQSDKHIQIRIKDVPIIAGALELAISGIRSSLFADNVELAPHLLRPDDARTALLFDPQTCGGLLATIPNDVAQSTLDALAGAGIEAAVIGQVVEGAQGLSYSD